MPDIFTLEKKDSLINGFEFSLGYFDLQIRFAVKLANLINISLEEALYRYTALYRRVVGTFRKSTDNDSSWINIFSNLSPDCDILTLRDLLYKAYLSRELSRKGHIEAASEDREFGCFGFDYNAKDNLIKVHFTNNIRGSRSSLSHKFVPERLNEIKLMFTYIKQHYPQATKVLGGSWLYNMEAYCRLYPQEFIDNMVPIPMEKMFFGGNSIWGQFQNKYGWTNVERYQEFIHKVENATTIEELFAAFPCWVLQPSCDIEIFYREYGIN